MALKFPVDEKEPGEIPALAGILADYPDCDGLLKFLCYRYDPKFEPVRAASAKMRNEVASSYAQWPEEGMPVILIEDVVTGFFRLLNDFEWELLCSREMVMEQVLEQMRVKFEFKAEDDPDKVSKAFLLKTDLDDRADKIMARLIVLYDKISDGDKEVEKVIKETRGSRRSISPERRAREGE